VAFRSQEHDQGCPVSNGSIASGGSKWVFGVGGKHDILSRATVRDSKTQQKKIKHVFSLEKPK